MTASLSPAPRPGSRWLLSLWCWQWPLVAGWPGWRTRRPLSVGPASSPGPAERPAERPDSVLRSAHSAGLSSSALSIPDTKPLWPRARTRPRQGAQASGASYLVYLHLNHQYRDLHLNAFSRRPSPPVSHRRPPPGTDFLAASRSLKEHFVPTIPTRSWGLQYSDTLG